MLDLYSNIIKRIENHEKKLCIFLDFVKAINTVNHEILLKKIASLWSEGYSIRIVSALPYKQTSGGKTWAIFVRISNSYLRSPSRKRTYSFQYTYMTFTNLKIKNSAINKRIVILRNMRELLLEKQLKIYIMRSLSHIESTVYLLGEGLQEHI